MSEPFDHRCVSDGPRHVRYRGIHIPIHCAKVCECGSWYIVTHHRSICCPDDEQWHKSTACCAECLTLQHAAAREAYSEANDLANIDVIEARKRQAQLEKILQRPAQDYDPNKNPRPSRRECFSHSLVRAVRRH